MSYSPPPHRHSLLPIYTSLDHAHGTREFAESFDFNSPQESCFSANSSPITPSIPVVRVPDARVQMPSTPVARALWFFRQVVHSYNSEPGAFITPRVFVPRKLWSIPTVSEHASRLLCCRAAFIESLVRSAGELEPSKKLEAGLRTKIRELWKDSLVNLPEPQVASNNQPFHTLGGRRPPSPPPSIYDEELPGPQRIHKNTRSRLIGLVRKSLVTSDNRNSVYSISSSNYPIGKQGGVTVVRSPSLDGISISRHVLAGNCLLKYIEALSNIADVFDKADDRWVYFIVFELASHVADDIFDLVSLYQQNLRDLLL